MLRSKIKNILGKKKRNFWILNILKCKQLQKTVISLLLVSFLKIILYFHLYLLKYAFKVFEYLRNADGRRNLKFFMKYQNVYIMCT